jgi:TrpR-related protein YerC/YecD
MAKKTVTERKLDMYRAILELDNLEECCAFFDDICSAVELRDMEQRFEVASMLHDKKVYTEIAQATNASSATISRVNRMLNYGTGCLEDILDRMENKNN